MNEKQAASLDLYVNYGSFKLNSAITSKLDPLTSESMSAFSTLDPILKFLEKFIGESNENDDIRDALKSAAIELLSIAKMDTKTNIFYNVFPSLGYISLYRGHSSESIFTIDYSRLSNGFVSTSKFINPAITFMRQPCCLFEIKVPYNTPMVDVNKHLPNGDFQNEHEYILPPGILYNMPEEIEHKLIQLLKSNKGIAIIQVSNSGKLYNMTPKNIRLFSWAQNTLVQLLGYIKINCSNDADPIDWLICAGNLSYMTVFGRLIVVYDNFMSSVTIPALRSFIRDKIILLSEQLLQKKIGYPIYGKVVSSDAKIEYRIKNGTDFEVFTWPGDVDDIGKLITDFTDYGITEDNASSFSDYIFDTIFSRGQELFKRDLDADFFKFYIGYIHRLVYETVVNFNLGPYTLQQIPDFPISLINIEQDDNPPVN